MLFAEEIRLATEADCSAFSQAAAALLSGRFESIPPTQIDDFVALGWVEGAQAAKRLTPLGKMTLARLRGTGVSASRAKEKDAP